jgi:CRISPR/Cas system-associated endoribonuclease Cas2
MLIGVPSKSPLSVYAWDVSCPTRARRVREAVFPHAAHRQLSVAEVRLPAVAVIDLFAELSLLVDLAEDRLALWRPRAGLRLAVLAGGGVMASTPGAHQLLDAAGLRRVLAGAGNVLISYDVSDPVAARQLHAGVAAGGAMVQRSVYHWRAAAAAVVALITEAGGWLAAGDRLWIHPLAAARDLWRAGAEASSLLPVATHHWADSATTTFIEQGDCEHGHDGLDG